MRLLLAALCPLLLLTPSASALESAAATATDGFYEDLQGSVYQYVAATGTTTYAFQDSGTFASTSEQNGNCQYVGDWTNPQPQGDYTYGKCVSMRTLGNAAHQFVWRLDARQVNGPTYNFMISVGFKDGNGNNILLTDPQGNVVGYETNISGYSCPSGAVQTCYKMPAGSGGKDQLNGPYPSTATAYCLHGRLWEVSASTTIQRLHVDAQCFAL